MHTPLGRFLTHAWRPAARTSHGFNAKGSVAMASMKKTPFVGHPWVILLIALGEETAKECETAVIPLPVIRVADVTGAIERVVALRPLVVVVGGNANAGDLAILRARAAEASSVFVGLEGTTTGPLLATKLRTAIHDAEAARVS